MQSLLQTEAWGKFKRQFAWRPERVGGTLVLERPLRFGQTMLYAPEVWLPKEPEQARRVVQELVDWARAQRQAIFFKLEVLNNHDESPLGLGEFGFQASFEEVQPTWRQVVGLAGTAEEILAQMKEKGRYNTRLAEKRGVKVEFSDDLERLEEDARAFFDLYMATAKRQRFAPRGEQYFRELLRMLYTERYGGLFLAKHEGAILAGAIIGWYDGVASYLYGASSDQQKELQAPYLMHYRAMLLAKERGSIRYDLLAVAPADGLSALAEKYAGITRFKQQLGGQTVGIVGGWDLVLKPAWYRVFRLAERMRRGLR